MSALSPAASLASALGGTVSSPSTIDVGAHTIRVFPTAGAWLLGAHGRRTVQLGGWRDKTDVLAAAYWAATEVNAA